MEKLVFKSYNDLIVDIKKNLAMLNSTQYDLVVGVPRSGMIPAYLISAYLNIDCIDLNGFIDNHRIQRGITRSSKYRLVYPHEAKNVLLVDDSIYSGDSIKKAIQKIPNELKFKLKILAIYSSSSSPKYVDLFFEYINGKKIFEWGIYHNNIINETCFDMDGVLCEDCDKETDSSQDAYINFLRNAKPLFLPTGNIHSIVTNRLEKFRSLTQDWLIRHNVEYKNLIMLNLESNIDKNKIDPAIDHKAKYYKKSNCVLFIESSKSQAERIVLFSGKPVFCSENNYFYEPGLVSKFVHSPDQNLKMYLNYYKHKIKNTFLSNKFAAI